MLHPLRLITAGSAACLALAAGASALSLPRGLEQDPSSSCTYASTHQFAWTLDAFRFRASYVFSTPAHQNSWGYADFNLTNSAAASAANSVVSCSAQSSQLSDFFYGSVWYTCSAAAANSSSSTTTTSFAFNRPTGEVLVNQTWTCRDNPQYPTKFHASGRATVSLGCTESTWQNPNWTLGAIYSDREVECAPATISMKPYKMAAVA